MSRLPYSIDVAQFDLLVVGAGINGAAIGRDAAMRGLRVLLVDKDDVGSGTTSWSTRLIHGGLRYLEHFEVPLVRESLHERDTLLRTAPHLVHPLHFLIPVYAEGSRSARVIRLGMLAYDVLSFNVFGRHVDHHRMLSPAETLRLVPGLDPDGLEKGALYHDAQAVYPERLALENALSAREHGALVLTHVRVTGFQRSGDRIVAVRLRHGGRALTVRVAHVMNAAGPWVDQVLADLPGERTRLIGGTKGSHLVVRPFPGAPETAVYTEAVDNRPYFIVPWAGNYLIGTTDIRYDGDLDEVAASDEEIDYLLTSTNQVLPTAALARDDVLWTYAGVRPLPYEPGVPAGKVTRGHVFHRDERLRNLVSVVGGKLTTHRSLAEEAVDRVFDGLGRTVPRCRTAEEHLPGGRVGDWRRFADGFREWSGLPLEISDRLLEVYGGRATEVLDVAGDDERLRAVLPGTATLAAEIPFAVRVELAGSLTDVYLRRTMLGLRGDQGFVSLDTAAAVARDTLGWSEARARDEVAGYRGFVAHDRRIPAPQPCA